MTQAQRRVLEAALRRAEKGPSLAMAYGGDVAEAEMRARLWSETWIAGPIRDVLAVEDHRLSSRALLYMHPSA